MTGPERDSKRRYHRVLHTIAANSSPKQLPGVTANQIMTHIGGQYGEFDREGIESTLRAAKQNGDVVTWTDTEGRIRYTLTVEDDLQRVVAHMNAHEYDPATIADVAETIQEVRGDE